MNDFIIDIISFWLSYSRFVVFKKDSIGYVENAQSPRMIKTHLPISMLPPNLLNISKVVVVARNVMDVCVSFFHMDKMTVGLDDGYCLWEKELVLLGLAWWKLLRRLRWFFHIRKTVNLWKLLDPFKGIYFKQGKIRMFALHI